MLGFEPKRLALVIVINIISLMLMIIRLASIPFSTIEISSVRDFNSFKNMPTAKCYQLTRDIDFGGKKVLPIKHLPKHCTFDGNGHTISNIKFTTAIDVTKKVKRTSSTYYCYASGLFAFCEGTIENLTMCDVEIEISQKIDHSSRDYYMLAVGAIAGYNGGRMRNCKVISYQEDLSNVVGLEISQSYRVYGICGRKVYDGVVENCELIESTTSRNSNAVRDLKKGNQDTTNEWSGKILSRQFQFPMAVNYPRLCKVH